MARYLESLFSPSDPPALLGGAEVHMVEYHHFETDLNWRTATMVVNFNDTPAARRTFGALRSTFVAARYSVNLFSKPEGVGQMCGCLRAQQFGTADAVIYTAGNLTITSETVQRVVDAVRAMGPGLVVVVDDTCRRWRDLQGVSGFVSGAESTSPATAAAVAISLATLCAPETLTCADHEDVGMCLGSAEYPAVLVEAFWLRRRQTMEFASVADGDVAKNADSIAVNLCAASLRMNDFSSILRTVRAWVGSNNVIMQAPVNSLISPWLHPSVVSLPMICRVLEPAGSSIAPEAALLTELVVRFPRLFRGKEPSAPSFLPLGWTQLVWELFQDVDRLLNAAQATSFEVLQVKEKLGRLRVRVRYSGTLDAEGDPETRLRALVAEASDQSEAVCRICGRLNKSRHRPRLWNVACEACCVPLAGIGSKD